MNENSGLQIYLGMGVVVAFLLAQLIIKPFADSTQDLLETLAQSCAAASLCELWVCVCTVAPQLGSLC